MTLTETVMGRATGARGLRAVAPLVEAAVRQAVAESAAQVARAAAQSIRDLHRSAPGEPPTTGTGELARNIVPVIDADARPGGPGASVESRAAHSRFLEFGTARMAARPFLRPALAQQRAPTRRRIADAVRLAVARAARATV